MEHKVRLRTPNWEAGFTMLELMIVIVILAMAAAVVIPRLPSTEETKLKDSARNVASLIRFLNDRAIISKASYRLRIDVTDNKISPVRLSEKGEEVGADDPFLMRTFIEDGITIEDVTSSTRGRITEGSASFTFGTRGMAELLAVHLKGGEKEFTVFAYPFGGRVEVQKDYKELPTEAGS